MSLAGTHRCGPRGVPNTFPSRLFRALTQVSGNANQFHELFALGALTHLNPLGGNSNQFLFPYCRAPFSSRNRACDIWEDNSFPFRNWVLELKIRHLMIKCIRTLRRVWVWRTRVWVRARNYLEGKVLGTPQDPLVWFPAMLQLWLHIIK